MQYPIMLKMADGTEKQFWLSDEKLQFGGAAGDVVTDVQVAGASVVQDGVANVPKASNTTLGVIKTGTNMGMDLESDGSIRTTRASNAHIDDRNSVKNQTLYNPIVPNNVDYAVKAALTDGKGAAWTAEEQAAARERIGFDNFELIADVTIAESVSSISVPVDFTKYKEIAISFFMFTDSAKVIRFGVKDKNSAVYLFTYDTPGANVGFFCDTTIEPGEDAYADVLSNKKFIAHSASCTAASWTQKLASYNRAQIYSGYRPQTTRRYDEMTQVYASVNTGQTIPAGASIMVYGRR